MTDLRTQLLDQIDADRDRIVSFLSSFIRARSPNPPGDTRAAAAVVGAFLDEEFLDHRVLAPRPEMPNVVASFEGAHPGPHLVLNGHMDVFPVGDESWAHDPWGGTVVDNRVYGRGACDMKAGTTASILAYSYLHRIRDRLGGRLTLTVVSDEETLGPWGAAYLLENHEEVRGDACLNGEPSGPWAVWFGERGLLWLAITIHTPGASGAYTHMSASATKIAAAIIVELESVADVEAVSDPHIIAALADARVETDRSMGAGAADVLPRVTINVGTITGGLKVNMIPGRCRLEVDIRIPVGVDTDDVLSRVAAVVARHRGAQMRTLKRECAASSDPHGDLAQLLSRNANALGGFAPKPTICLGASDARLWRLRGIPAYAYGPRATGMGADDEYVEIDEFLHTVRTHVVSAVDYLNQHD